MLLLFVVAVAESDETVRLDGCGVFFAVCEGDGAGDDGAEVVAGAAAVATGFVVGTAVVAAGVAVVAAGLAVGVAVVTTGVTVGAAAVATGGAFVVAAGAGVEDTGGHACALFAGDGVDVGKGLTTHAVGAGVSSALATGSAVVVITTVSSSRRRSGVANRRGRERARGGGDGAERAVACSIVDSENSSDARPEVQWPKWTWWPGT